MAKKIPKRTKEPNWGKLSLLYSRGIRPQEFPGTLSLNHLRSGPPHIGGDLPEGMAKGFHHGRRYDSYTCSILREVHYEEAGETRTTGWLQSRVRYHVKKTSTRLEIYREDNNQPKTTNQNWVDHQKQSARIATRCSNLSEIISNIDQTAEAHAVSAWRLANPTPPQEHIGPLRNQAPLAIKQLHEAYIQRREREAREKHNREQA